MARLGPRPRPPEGVTAVADPETRIRALLRGHGPVVIGAGAAVAAVGLGYVQLRRGQAAAAAGGSAAASAGSGLTGADLAAAQQSGAAAAIAGFTPSVDLANNALGLAGTSVGVSGDVAVALAQSQAQVAAGAQQLAGDLGAGLVSLLPTEPALPAPTPGGPPPSPVGATCNGQAMPPNLGIPGGPWVCTASGWQWTPATQPTPTPTPVTKPPSTAAPTYTATVTATTHLWNDGTQRWVYTLAPGTRLSVRGAGYVKGGVECYPVNGPAPYGGYYVPKANVRLS